MYFFYGSWLKLFYAGHSLFFLFYGVVLGYVIIVMLEGS